MAYFTANSMRGFRSWLFTFSVSVHNSVITRLSPYLVYETPFWALSKLIPQGRFHIVVMLPGSYSCFWWRKFIYYPPPHVVRAGTRAHIRVCQVDLPDNDHVRGGLGVC